jgi:FMN phosphatase YigB (HAD superfamily)
MYISAARHLALPPYKVCMVTGDIGDLIQAAKLGFKTIYVKHPDASPSASASVRMRSEGGEVDAVVESFSEIADLIK